MNYEESDKTLNLPVVDSDKNSAWDFDVDGVAGMVGANHAATNSTKKKIYISRRQMKLLPGRRIW